jgi:ribose transport system permease protein
MATVTLSIQEKLNRQAIRNERLIRMLPFVGLVFITVLLAIVTNGKLVKPSNLLVLLNNTFTVSLVALGAAFVFAHGGMDFSIGASSGLAQYVALILLTRSGLPVFVAILASVLVCLISSTLVGSVAVLLRVPSFVTSICVRAICTGLLAGSVNSASGGRLTIDFAKYNGFNNEFLKLGVLIAFIAFAYFLFEETVAGRNLKAIGGNTITAFQAGVKLSKNTILSYSFLGFCVGVAAFFQLTRIGVVSANSGAGLEFDIMVAIILGGFPMAGGSTARIRSVIIGAITLTVLFNGLIIWGLDPNLVNGVKGLLFIIVVTLSYDRTNLKQVKMITS